jgi:hypothetical protein
MTRLVAQRREDAAAGLRAAAARLDRTRALI